MKALYRFIAIILPWYNHDEADRKSVITDLIARRAEVTAARAKVVTESYRQATTAYGRRKPQWPD
jgi:hypothetical protein